MKRLLALMCGLALLATAHVASAKTWHDDAFFGLHFDLHAGPGDTQLGAECNEHHIRAELDKVKPDFVTFDCKGHPGYASYPTKIGAPAPHIKKDMLKIWRKVTRDMGIPLSIHFSGVWDMQAIKKHPEWAVLDANGKPSENYTCLLSDYRATYMTPQIIEVIKEYDVDGIWCDGEIWAVQPCYCERCKAAFKKETGLDALPKNAQEPNWDKFLAMHRRHFSEHVAAYTAELKKVKPSFAVCSNWMYSVRHPEDITVPVDYISGDFDPNWGSNRAAAESRFMAGRGKTWDLMAWAFTWAPERGATFFKPVPHLCQEIAQPLAQGGAMFVYEQPQRTGRLTGWHMDTLGEVAKFARARKAVSFQTQTIPQVAVLNSLTWMNRFLGPVYTLDPTRSPLEGAMHALLECGYSVDLLNETDLIKRMDQYPLVVVPEMAGLPENLRKALAQYVGQGGRLLISGINASAEYGELTGATPVTDTAISPTGVFLQAGAGATCAVDKWQAVKLTGSAQPLSYFLGQQDVVFNKTQFPSASVNDYGKGKVVAIHGDVFANYMEFHYPLLRTYIADAVKALNAPGLLKREGAWWIEMAARQKDGRKLIQFINRGSANPLYTARMITEAVADAGPFMVTIPMAKAPQRCYMAPDQTGLDWSWANGVLTARISGLAIHNVLVIE